VDAGEDGDVCGAGHVRVPLAHDCRPDVSDPAVAEASTGMETCTGVAESTLTIPGARFEVVAVLLILVFIPLRLS
jgi:hypothetical protein